MPSLTSLAGMRAGAFGRDPNRARERRSDTRIQRRDAAMAGAGSALRRSPGVDLAFLFLVTLACYWRPLTSDETSILWDAADQFQPYQNYVSQELRSGRIPFWTPYLLAGFPLLAEPQTGAWYPFNWPFFLIGVAPRALVAEHFLHALIACFGAYFLTRRLVESRWASILAGMGYGLSGFFVGHSSHTPMIQTAAWTPWLLLLFDRALAADPVRNTLLAGLTAGALILAGHFQTALYSLLALALFAAAQAITRQPPVARAAFIALAPPVIGTLLAAVTLLPALELTLLSVRTTVDALLRTEGMLPLGALATLVDPDYYGVLSNPPHEYRGPVDITQYYFYAGLCLVPLAVVGLTARTVRLVGLLLIVPTIWYAAGHWAGLYLLMARLPGFSSIRSPVHIWFVPALGLAVLSGAGLQVLARARRIAWLAPVIVIVTAGDLYYRNSAVNSLAYARMSYARIYRNREDQFRSKITRRLPPLTRFDAPPDLTAYGPLNHPLDVRTETTYGYVPLILTRYQEYVDSMRSNAKLRNGLNVALWLESGTIRPNPDVLPRAYFPRRLVRVASYGEERQRLSTLDPAQEAIVTDPIAVNAQDGDGVAEVRTYAPGRYTIHYRAQSPSLLRVSNAWFPGWTAVLRDQALDVVPVDHALVGVVVPAGEGEIELVYRSRYFAPGAAISVASLLTCGIALMMTRRRQRRVAAARPQRGSQRRTDSRRTGRGAARSRRPMSRSI